MGLGGGVTLETVDMLFQVQGLVEAMDVRTQVQGLEGYHSGDCRYLTPGTGKIPWRRKWHPTPVLLPQKSHGRRNLVGYSPLGCKESDMTEQLHFTSQGLGRESPWRMWMCDPGTRSGKGHHDGNCQCVSPGTMSWRMVTVETVDM